MADKETPEPTTPAPEPNQEDAFWDKFNGNLTKQLDTWFDGKVKAMREQGTSRTGGRTTLPKIVADMFFGADKT